MAKRLILILQILLYGGFVNAQLLPLLDQYHMNRLAINPAFAGSQDALDIELYSRKQWTGFEGAPKTITLSAHSPLRNSRVNLGVILLSDQYGFNTERGMLFNYAYRLPVRRGKLAMGLAAGASWLSTDIEALRYLHTGDLLIMEHMNRAILPQFSTGIYYQGERLHLGFSMPLFLQHRYNEQTAAYSTGFGPGNLNYVGTIEYLLNVKENIQVLASMLLKANPGDNTQLDLGVTGIFKRRIWLGITGRTNGHLTFMVQAVINEQIRFGYAYGYEWTELRKVQGGSHELILAYRFKYIVDTENPRAL